MLPDAALVPVHDPAGAADDRELPTVRAALEPEVVEWELLRLPAVDQAPLRAIRVVRHDPGRRCLIEYELEGGATLLGEIQSRRCGKSDYRLLVALREAGFDDAAPDAITVPEPLGVIGSLGMWLQRAVTGEPAAEVIERTRDPRLGRSIAEAAHKLHRGAVTPARVHGVDDELRILDDCLAKAAFALPRLADRVSALRDRCVRLAQGIDQPVPTGIHRDFSAERVLVAPGRLTLVGFHRYCLGDPALDIGSLVGQLTEQALRRLGDATALHDAELAVASRFSELAGARAGLRAETYAVLTLARHVYVSTQFADRRRHAEPLLELCEERLS